MKSKKHEPNFTDEEIDQIKKQVAEAEKCLKDFTSLEFKQFKCMNIASFDTETYGLRYYDEERDEEEEFEFDDYCLSRDQVMQVIYNVCEKNARPTSDDIQNALKAKAEELMCNDDI